MILREKIQIALIFVGLFSVGFGIALMQPGRNRGDQPQDQSSQRVGFWKDTGVSLDYGRTVGPWLIVGGVASFFAAYLSRER
jgi:hypothetical protein